MFIRLARVTDLSDSSMDRAELSTGHFSWTRPDPVKPWPDPARPDPTRPDPTRPDPRLLTKSLTRPAARPFPICVVFNLIIICQLVYYSILNIVKINQSECIVFEDSYRFRYQEIISEKLQNPKCWPDSTRQNPAKSWLGPARPDPTRPDPTRPDPTRPDSTRGSIRPVDNSGTEYGQTGQSCQAGQRQSGGLVRMVRLERSSVLINRQPVIYLTWHSHRFVKSGTVRGLSDFPQSEVH